MAFETVEIVHAHPGALTRAEIQAGGTKLLASGRWELAYDGGHHSVWCNGHKHVTTGGGYCGITDRAQINSVRRCDCEAWGNPTGAKLRATE